MARLFLAHLKPAEVLYRLYSVIKKNYKSQSITKTTNHDLWWLMMATYNMLFGYQTEFMNSRHRKSPAIKWSLVLKTVLNDTSLSFGSFRNLNWNGCINGVLFAEAEIEEVASWACEFLSFFSFSRSWPANWQPDEAWPFKSTQARSQSLEL